MGLGVALKRCDCVGGAVRQFFAPDLCGSSREWAGDFCFECMCRCLSVRVVVGASAFCVESHCQVRVFSPLDHS